MSPSPAAESTASASSAKQRGRKTSPASTSATKAATNATPAPGGGHGLVWVNTETHVYHKEGSRFYGTTKKGKYMSEAEAVKEGDRAAKGGE
ncbi:MAG: signal protein [Verrucomicrobia bacterium]|nr:MAG: signal protein [Verrucomicrobiota bacterium]